MGAGICPICERSAQLVRHHLLPRAAGGTDGRRNIIRICDGCHRLVHAHFGDGDKFTGPTQKKALIKEMRTPRRRAAPPGKRRTRRRERPMPKLFIRLTDSDTGHRGILRWEHIDSCVEAISESGDRVTQVFCVGDAEHGYLVREGIDEIERMIDEARGAGS